VIFAPGPNSVMPLMNVVEPSLAVTIEMARAPLPHSQALKAPGCGNRGQGQFLTASVIGACQPGPAARKATSTAGVSPDLSGISQCCGFMVYSPNTV
jgi:hypothetical protein